MAQSAPPQKPGKGNLLLPLTFLLPMLFLTVAGPVGAAMDVLLGPVALSTPFYLVVLLLGVVTGTVGSVFQRLLVDVEKTREVQEKLKAYNKERLEAMKSQNKFKLKRLEEQKVGMMRLQSEVASQSFRPTVFILMVSMPIFLWMSYHLGAIPPAQHPLFRFPMLGGRMPTDITLVMFPYWIVWYSLCSIPVGMVVRRLLDFHFARRAVAPAA